MLCVEQSDLEVQGKIGTVKGQSIFIDIVKCSTNYHGNCKSDEEIERYFDGLFMYIMSN